jgi:hypothetical protein
MAIGGGVDADSHLRESKPSNFDSNNIPRAWTGRQISDTDLRVWVICVNG